MYAWPSSPAIEATFTMHPRVARRWGRAVRHTRKGPVRFTSSARCHSASVQLVDPPELRYARHVGHDVEPSVAVDGVRHGGLDRGPVGHVAGDGLHALGRVGPQVHAHDRRAVVAQPLGHRPPDARRHAGDERDPRHRASPSPPSNDGLRGRPGDGRWRSRSVTVRQSATRDRPPDQAGAAAPPETTLALSELNSASVRVPLACSSLSRVSSSTGDVPLDAAVERM